MREDEVLRRPSAVELGLIQGTRERAVDHAPLLTDSRVEAVYHATRAASD